jgi:hypothetical protein
MGDEGRDDPDRAAILARRQRFIALALSGLSASCGGDKDGKPQPCLDIAPMTESNSDDGASSTTTGMPVPCLDIGPMTESTTSVDSTGTDSTGTDTTGTDSTDTATTDADSTGDTTTGG